MTNNKKGFDKKRVMEELGLFDLSSNKRYSYYKYYDESNPKNPRQIIRIEEVLQ